MSFKTKDNFEAVYLKNNSLKKAFAPENKEKVDALSKRKDFVRCIKFLAKNSFMKNKTDLLKLGFDYEDMYNICLTFGLSFAVEDLSKFNTDKDLYYVLMRFVNQRLESFFITLDRKFHYKESYTDVSIESIGLNNLEVIKESTVIPEYINDNITQKSLEEEFDSLYKEYEVASGHEKANLKRMLAVTEDKIKEFEVMVEDSHKAIKSNLAKFKPMLKEDLSKYSEKLAYLATYKKVEHPVRKKARLLCKKNGINYVEIMSKIITSKNLNRVDYILDK